MDVDYEESWVLKNWCYWTVVLEKTLESPLDCKEIQLVHSEGDQRWDFFGRNDAKAETPVLWPPHAKSWRIGKDSDAGRDWGQEEKGTTEDEMAGWNHWLDGRESQWTPGVGDGQGCLAGCNSWGRKESDMTEWLNWLTDSSRAHSLNGSQPQNVSLYHTESCTLTTRLKWTEICLLHLSPNCRIRQKGSPSQSHTGLLLTRDPKNGKQVAFNVFA